MRPNFFRAYGLVVLLPALFSAVGLIDRYLSPLPIGAAWFRHFFLTAVAMLLGWGLFALRKWAALYFSLPLFCFGVWEFFKSIPEVTFPYNLLLMAHALSLTLPLVVTILAWKHLTWGRRFF